MAVTTLYLELGLSTRFSMGNCWIILVGSGCRVYYLDDSPID